MKDTAGPAFPLVYDDETKGTREIYSGMTLRDWFAGKAMQSHLTHSGTYDANEVGVAKWAYEMADAMIRARKNV